MSTIEQKRAAARDPEVFVTAWQGSKDLAEVADRTGYSTRYASQRAARYRAAGVPLKHFRGGRRLTEIEVPDPKAAAAMLVLSDLDDGTGSVTDEPEPSSDLPDSVLDEEGGEDGW